VTVDGTGRSSLPGLWAAGEVSSSGLHGANRLASNSLLEGLVYGERAARDIASELAAAGPWALEVPPVSAAAKEGKEGRPRIDLDDLRKSLRALMWRHMGITRDGSGLEHAAVQVDHWCRYVLPHVFDDPPGWAIQNMLITARLMIAAAIERKESRGVHSRSDFPEADPAWLLHIAMLSPSPGEPVTRRRSSPAVDRPREGEPPGEPPS
jgi:L-aspartate oxidase